MVGGQQLFTLLLLQRRKHCCCHLCDCCAWLQILSYRRQAEMKTNIHAAHQRLDRMTRVRWVTESYRTFHAQPRYVSHARARSALERVRERDLGLENRDCGSWKPALQRLFRMPPFFSQFFSAFGDLVAGFPVSSLGSRVSSATVTRAHSQSVTSDRPDRDPTRVATKSVTATARLEQRT